MQCEICGNNIKGEMTKIKVDFSEFIVCKNCIKYGIIIKNKEQKENDVIENKIKQSKNKKNYFKDLDKNLIENYDEIIKNARLKLNMTQEDLANRLKEKVHLIKKIERKEISPEENIIKKIEKILDVNLLENSDNKNNNISTHKKNEITIGDIAYIKHQKN